MAPASAEANGKPVSCHAAVPRTTTTPGPAERTPPPTHTKPRWKQRNMCGTAKPPVPRLAPVAVPEEREARRETSIQARAQARVQPPRSHGAENDRATNDHPTNDHPTNDHPTRDTREIRLRIHPFVD